MGIIFTIIIISRGFTFDFLFLLLIFLNNESKYFGFPTMWRPDRAAVYSSRAVCQGGGGEKLRWQDRRQKAAQFPVNFLLFKLQNDNKRSSKLWHP